MTGRIARSQTTTAIDAKIASESVHIFYSQPIKEHSAMVDDDDPFKTPSKRRRRSRRVEPTPKQLSVSDGLSNSRSSHQQRPVKTTQLYRACQLIRISGQRIHYTWGNDLMLYLVETENMSRSWKRFLNYSKRRPVGVSVSITHRIPGKRLNII